MQTSVDFRAFLSCRITSILWTVSQFPSLEKPVLQSKNNARVDKVALSSLPKDAPVGLYPYETTGDGNCFPQALSKALFGNESHHREICLCLVIEGVKNKSHYLDNSHLSLGATHIHGRGTFPQQYAMFSGQQFPTCGDLDDIVESIYDTEMVQIINDGTFMGMWQLWAAANVIGRPIRSVFPECGSYQFRSDFNRLCVPLNER